MARKDQTLGDLLAGVPALADGQSIEDYTGALFKKVTSGEAKGRQALIAANAHRVRLALALLEDEPKKGEKGNWQAAHATRLGMEPRNLRYWLSAGRAVLNLGDLANGLPARVLDRRVSAIPRAVKMLADERDPDVKVPRPPQSPVEAWVKAADKLIESIPEPQYSADATALGRAMERVKAAAELWLNPPPMPVTSHGVEPNPGDKLGTALQYAGGKWKVAHIVSHVIGVLPPDAELREPFCGGASVSVEMVRSGRAARVWLNDIDVAVRAVWNSLLHEMDALEEALLATVNTGENFKRLRRAVPLRGKIKLKGVELAAAEVYLRATTNSSRANGRWDPTSRWVPERFVKRIREVSHLLQGKVVHGECTGHDFLEVIRAPGEAVLFLDPPYARTTEVPGLYRAVLSHEQHHQLADALRTCGHPFVMTIGDDDVSEAMHIPGSEVRRIPSGVGQKYMLWGEYMHEGAEREQHGGKRELLWTSGVGGAWGHNQLDEEEWEEMFGEGADADPASQEPDAAS